MNIEYETPMNPGIEEIQSNTAQEAVVMTTDSSCCSETMEDAKEVTLDVGEYVTIRCPEGVAWRKITVTKTGNYTMYTHSDLDTVGRLYDCTGALVNASDNAAGDTDFVMNTTLFEGCTYYLRLSLANNCCGSFWLMVGTCIESITVSKSAIAIAKGDTYDLSATISPAVASDHTIVWSSNKHDIAAVHESCGTVLGRKEGAAIIYARAKENPSIYAKCKVVVLPIEGNVEYHLLCNGDINNALRVGFRNVLEFKYISPVRGERLSYWNRQKWVVKSEGESKKIYTKLDKTYCLSNISGKAYVSNNATNNNAELTIAPHGNSGDDCTIKLTNQNLYLTLVHGNYQDVTGLHADCNGMTAYWGEWKEYNALDPSNQVWQFVEQPANHHYGVDTYDPIDNAVANALKNDGYDFVVRYYTSLSEQETGKLLKNTEVSTLHNANLKIVSVYQDYGENISDFSIEKANLHAERAMELAEDLGQPMGSVIYFAVDYSPLSGELNTIAQYFNTIKNKLNGKYRIGVYGTAEVCDLIKPNVASHSWLSHKIRSDTDSIEGTPEYISYDSQLKYDIKQAEQISYHGQDFDYDTAIGNDYGQW